jgi:hypothetical protein
MLDRSTVLVLGAGASRGYGFPLGTELKQTISKQLADETGMLVKDLTGIDKMTGFGFSMEQVREFKRALDESFDDTVDAFLENQPTYRRIGTLCIAHVLLRTEQVQTFFEPTSNRPRGWYKTLFKALQFTRSALTDAPPIQAIVTFNYERSLEMFLQIGIQRTLAPEFQKTAFEKLKNIPVIHTYGMFGPLAEVPFQPEQYSNNILPHVNRGGESIQLVFDNVDDSEGVVKARSEIEKAKHIVFLGFGYHRLNLGRLGLLHNPMEGRRITGSVYGANMNQVAADFGPGSHISLTGYTVDQLFSQVAEQP